MSSKYDTGDVACNVPIFDTAGELFRNSVRRTESSELIDLEVVRAPKSSTFGSFL